MPGIRLTVVLDCPEAVYSGMVPGFVAGEYDADDLEIDGVPLARRAGARVILAPATRVVPALKRIELQDRPPIHYDVASLDVGSTVKGLDRVGVAEFALPTRPIRNFVDQVRERARLLGDAPQVAVVGGGAAGVEIALSLDAYLRSEGKSPEFFVVTDGQDLLPGSSGSMRRALRREFRKRKIRHQAGQRVARVGAGRLGDRGRHASRRGSRRVGDGCCADSASGSVAASEGRARIRAGR